jgi:hypothetical protein
MGVFSKNCLTGQWEDEDGVSVGTEKATYLDAKRAASTFHYLSPAVKYRMVELALILREIRVYKTFPQLLPGKLRTVLDQSHREVLDEMNQLFDHQKLVLFHVYHRQVST